MPLNHQGPLQETDTDNRIYETSVAQEHKIWWEVDRQQVAARHQEFPDLLIQWWNDHVK